MAKESGQTAPKADQPRVSTGSLQRNESMPSLTYRQTGVKNYAKQGRKSKR